MENGSDKLERSQLAAAPSSEAPTSERFGIGRIAAAIVGLLLLGGGLAALASVTHDDAVASRPYEVERGKISVIGTSRLRTWTGDGYSLVLPANWTNPKGGQVTFKTLDGKIKDAPIGKFVWKGPDDSGELTMYVGDEFYTLSQRRKSGLLPKEPASLDSTSTLFGNPRARRPGDDLGPVPVNGTRPAWRWLHTDPGTGGKPATRNVDFYFTTCKDGKRARAWTVQTSAPANAYDEGTFNSIVRSLKTDQLPAGADGACE